MKTKARARSVPRARVASSPSPPPSTCSTAYPSAARTRQQQQRDSVLSQQSSLYPPSTVTSTSAFSGPETPPEHSLDLPLLDVDDVSYRLKLLVKNNYFLPPPHLKPTQHQLSALPTTPLKSPTLRTLFRPNKSPKSPQSPPIPQVPVFKPRNTRPQNRVVVIRETLPELVPEPLPLSDEYTSPVETYVDPTDDVDSAQPVVRSAPIPNNPGNDQQPSQGDWRKDLLAQAVGLSFVSSQLEATSFANPQPDAVTPVDHPPRKQSLQEASQPSSLGQPISLSVANVAIREYKQSKPSEPPSSALKPPPRPPRDRGRRGEDSPIVNDSHSPNPLLHNRSPLTNGHEQGTAEAAPRNSLTQAPIRPSFTQSPRPSFSQSPPYSLSPFGNTASPPRFSGATDHTHSTATLHFDDHDTAGRNSLSRPSMSVSSMHSEPPRPSLAESRVSHYSTTFGDRRRDSNRQSRTSGRSSDVTAPNSRRSSLAYLRDTRSRSLSPSRAAFTPPPVPPLPTCSDTEGTSSSTVIYLHSTGALSNTALGNSSVATISPVDTSPSTRLNPKRGITNCPTPSNPPSPRFFGLKSPKAGSPRMLPVATVDVDIILNDAPLEENQHSDTNVTVESWRHAQVHQEAARKFDGMVVQHIESEKDRFKRIASRGKSD